MKSKGAIKFFAIALTLVCLYHLSFTFVSWRVEEKAREFAQGDIEKERRYLDSIANTPVYNLFVREYTYQQVKERELNLGLDLRGGMHVTLEVDVRELLLELSNHNEDESFREALQMARQAHLRNPQVDFVTHFRDAYEDLTGGGQLAAIFSHRETRERIGPNASNADVASYLRSEARESLDVTHNIIRSRIDRYGVAQPNIQKQEGAGRILVELPGVDDPQRVRRLLQESAELAFWETYNVDQIMPYLEEANQILARDLRRERSMRTPGETPEDAEAFVEQDLFEDENADTDTVTADTAADDALVDMADPDQLSEE